MVVNLIKNTCTHCDKDIGSYCYYYCALCKLNVLYRDKSLGQKYLKHLIFHTVGELGAKINDFGLLDCFLRVHTGHVSK